MFAPSSPTKGKAHGDRIKVSSYARGLRLGLVIGLEELTGLGHEQLRFSIGDNNY
jgi:hypothetical protein